jgi:hypothetical protein
MDLLTGNEHFSLRNESADYTINDFWRWSSSDLLNNAMRGKIAEFIVAKALGIDTGSVRNEWDAYDLLYNGKIKVEVKASSYVQSWHSDKRANSTIQFTIRSTKAWTVEGFRSESVRQSDMYIFCIHAERVKSKANPMLLEQWEFYPVLTKDITDKLGNQKTAGLSTVKQLCPEPFKYDKLHDAVKKIMLFNFKT